jgi:hypothetical protein
MNAKVLITALALGSAAVYAVRQFKARKSTPTTGMPTGKNRMGKVPAFSATRTPTPPY